MNQSAHILKNASAADRVAYLAATGLGAGLSRFAPGTMGAMEGVAIYLATTLFGLGKAEHLLLLVALDVLIFALGVWSSDRLCQTLGVKDPSRAVIDEISGQLIALTPLAFAHSWRGVVVGFALFRLFDIFKPYPIRRLERLSGGYGVMMDDALAGIYAAALVWLGAQLNLL
ncbi:MAG: phosphatidylglycerophosphatase A [Acidobacteriota bacterium]